MKFVVGILFLLALGSTAAAQDTALQDVARNPLTKGTWELGLFASGGQGVLNASNTQFAAAGGRVGVILTKDHLSGWLRGNFEWAFDVMPVYTIITPHGAVYGGSLKPIIWRWNFTRGKTVVPYVAAAGGIVFSTANIPPGDTSSVNFTPQALFGADIFVKRSSALFLECAVVHHSNDNLGTLNPGYDAALFFTVGYSWFKNPR